MWGYIVSCQIYQSHRHVPSLYVRVYLPYVTPPPASFRSLIICEGISEMGACCYIPGMFPHYMWGYILYPPAGGFKFWLPSLYVRVYRSGSFAYEGKWSSLIICEGISPDILDLRYKWLFPHYMWGYIAATGAERRVRRLPSLYVRVYHQHGKLLKSLKCSLIICEGISGTLIFGGWWILFPHYMWGYIPPAGRTAKRSFVPSLYMRVYRNRQWHPSGIKKYKCSWR